MVIIDVQWRTYRLPLRSVFTTAHGAITAREGAIVEIITDQGISGIGEIAPLPEFAVAGGILHEALTLLPVLTAHLRGKTLREALDLLRSNVWPGLKDTAGEWPTYGERDDAASRRGRFTVPTADLSASVFTNSPAASFKPGPATCGLETALLDALGKAEGCGISTLLCATHPGPRQRVQVNATVGARATEAAVTCAQEAIAAGFACVKLKVGWEHESQAEIERVAAVREAIGPNAHLRLDANEAWNLEQAIAILSNCAQFDIQYVEQPIKACDLVGMRTLRQAVPVPVAADEAVYSLQSARDVLDSEAADILVVKPQLAGGLRAGQQIIQEAAQRGVRCVVTSTIEAGIGLVAALHLAAASPAITLECGLATLHLLVDDLLMEDLPIRNGYLTVPTGPGLGILLDDEALERYGLRCPI